MPITPQSILPQTAPTQIATGTIRAMGTAAAAVELDGGTLVTAAVPGNAVYAVGQRVMVSIPGGQLASAVITGLATGSASAPRQVHVPFRTA